MTGSLEEPTQGPTEASSGIKIFGERCKHVAGGTYFLLDSRVLGPFVPLLGVKICPAAGGQQVLQRKQVREGTRHRARLKQAPHPSGEG